MFDSARLRQTFVEPQKNNSADADQLGTKKCKYRTYTILAKCASRDSLKI
jgi:hypothetical protein